MLCAVFLATTFKIIAAYLEENCGYQAPFFKILDGEMTAIDEFPWMALLEYRNQSQHPEFGCAGSLFTKRHVLTTAHCIEDLKLQNLELFSVRLGEYNTTSDIDCVEMMGFQDCADRPQDIPVASWATHPGYHKHIHDIAVVKLAYSAEFSDFVRPICLPPPTMEVDVGEMMTAAGWGRTKKEKSSDVKLKVRVPVVTFMDCFQKYSVARTILNASQHVCAGSVLGKDACTGDSGGPLMTTKGEDGRWKIVGVISTGNGCGLEGWPGIYMRVQHYRQWVIDQVKNL